MTAFKGNLKNAISPASNGRIQKIITLYLGTQKVNTQRAMWIVNRGDSWLTCMAVVSSSCQPAAQHIALESKGLPFPLAQCKSLLYHHLMGRGKCCLFHASAWILARVDGAATVPTSPPQYSIRSGECVHCSLRRGTGQGSL